uniref:Uncharacterized protein n=1 Tax=Kalanchoe fedtschenkoi TaxID=63787 RepID=A0A7N0V5Y6_KALFE
MADRIDRCRCRPSRKQEHGLQSMNQSISLHYTNSLTPQLVEHIILASPIISSLLNKSRKCPSPSRLTWHDRQPFLTLHT